MVKREAVSDENFVYWDVSAAAADLVRENNMASTMIV